MVTTHWMAGQLMQNRWPTEKQLGRPMVLPVSSYRHPFVVAGLVSWATAETVRTTGATQNTVPPATAPALNRSRRVTRR